MRLTAKRRQILKQLTLEGSLDENRLECSRHTRHAIRDDFVSHELMYVEKKEALGSGPGGRPRNVWSIKMNGVILALKNGLVTPSEVSNIVQQKLVDWIEKGLRYVKNPRSRRAFRKLALMFSRYIGKRPEVCNLLKMFDFEFCAPVMALISVMEVSYALQFGKLSTKQKSEIKSQYGIAVKALPDLANVILS